jgi:hypothetical protein
VNQSHGLELLFKIGCLNAGNEMLVDLPELPRVQVKKH